MVRTQGERHASYNPRRSRRSCNRDHRWIHAGCRDAPRVTRNAVEVADLAELHPDAVVLVGFWFDVGQPLDQRPDPQIRPAAQKWTTFELPVRGTEIHHISFDERNGTTKVVMPVYRTNQMGVMTLRSEADIAAVEAQATK